MPDTELDVALDADRRQIWAELGLDVEELVVPTVRVRVTSRPQVKITPRPLPPAGVVEIAHERYHRARLDGSLAPGTYRIYPNSWSGFRETRYETITVPSRCRTWARSPRGWLWHRVRWCEIRWQGVCHRRTEPPRLFVAAWCGPAVASGYRSGPPLMADHPTGERCTKCDTSIPDLRRLPDRLEESRRG